MFQVFMRAEPKRGRRGETKSSGESRAKKPKLLVNERDENGRTQLYRACEEGRSKVVEELLQVEGIDVNLGDGNGETPLFAACGIGHSKVVKLLLKHKGIQVNQADNYGITPLYTASLMGESKVVELLLKAEGIQVNQASKNGWTPLHVACVKGHSKVVERLLGVEGIQVNRAAVNGSTPLFMACWKGHSEVVERLLGVADVNRANDIGETPLFVACWNGHSKVVELLLGAKGIDVNRADNPGNTPLFIACLGGHSEVSIRLLKFYRWLGTDDLTLTNGYVTGDLTLNELKRSGVRLVVCDGRMSRASFVQCVVPNLGTGLDAVCPITQFEIDCPVRCCNCKVVFEAESLKGWLKRGNACPPCKKDAKVEVLTAIQIERWNAMKKKEEEAERGETKEAENKYRLANRFAQHVKISF